MCFAGFCGASANPLSSLVPQSQALRSTGLRLFRLWPNSRCSPRALGLFSMLRFRTLASQREIVSYLSCPSSKHHGLETQSWRPKYSFAPLSPRKILIQAEAKDLFFFFPKRWEISSSVCSCGLAVRPTFWTLKCLGLFSWNLSSSGAFWDMGLRIDDGRIISWPGVGLQVLDLRTSQAEGKEVICPHDFIYQFSADYASHLSSPSLVFQARLVHVCRSWGTLCLFYIYFCVFQLACYVKYVIMEENKKNTNI